jgi:hypothetical protein
MKPEMRQQLAQLPFEEKIAKVGELIRLRRKIKTGVSEDAALLASLDKAAAELDAGKGDPIERVREKICGWAGNNFRSPSTRTAGA